jgi:hypothetical protein
MMPDFGFSPVGSATSKESPKSLKAALEIHQYEILKFLNYSYPKRPKMSAAMKAIPFLWQKSLTSICSSKEASVSTTTCMKLLTNHKSITNNNVLGSSSAIPGSVCRL